MFEVEKMALKYCEQHGIAEGDPRYNDVLTAFCVGYKYALEASKEVESSDFEAWYDTAIWGNEDFKDGCQRSWNAALEHVHPAPAVPEGWQLVPKEPTNAMEFAADEKAIELVDRAKGFWYWRHIYKAMLSAAPEVKK